MRASGQTSRPACKVLSKRDWSLSDCPEIRPAAIAIPIAGPPETSSKRLKGQVMIFASLFGASLDSAFLASMSACCNFVVMVS